MLLPAMDTADAVDGDDGEYSVVGTDINNNDNGWTVAGVVVHNIANVRNCRCEAASCVSTLLFYGICWGLFRSPPALPFGISKTTTCRSSSRIAKISVRM